ncbi:lytic murein transglycosylase [Curvivirga aplysinae]|uniref:lytic murein transglycosylase n=1 Tax=Curvivirga aplysinae TaxID=2529852 RepID=UPI001C3FA218|nr:lytic murein transglycosylase [Curvivirga aplysinae]
MSFANISVSAQDTETKTETTNSVAPAEWLNTFKQTALKEGISEITFDKAFASWEPVEKVLYYDRRQPEFSRTFWGYIERSISKERIERGRRLLKEHKPLLNEVYQKFGVQPRFLVAFWGLETNFGDYTGGFPVVDALATLAHDPRRSEFFTKELLLALQILDQGHIAQDRMLGSWAGAMGQTQFMPSTFTGYAFDGDNDGKKDLWGSLTDVMYSSSNYLSQIGWNKDQTWGREVKLPSNFNYELADLNVQKDLSEWQKLGVRRANGTDLPLVVIDASIVLPAGHKGPAFVVYNNFRKIMIWNRSILYAIAVGHLADQLQGKGGLVAKKPANDKPLHRDEAIALQTALNILGFNAGNPDGILGSKTRAAVKEYQIRNDLPADGYPEASLVERIISEANG